MKRALLLALIAVFAVFGPAAAQETTTGTLTGQVMDAQGGAIPGATVSLVSAQGTKTFVTDANGKFFAPFLTPGRYAVRVELSGFRTLEQKAVDVRLGQRVELSNLVLQIGTLEEVVEIIGTAPVVDTNSTTVGGVLDSDVLKRLPVGRNFTDALYLVPGVSDSGVGNANPSLSGASGLENNYVVDGVNITNAGYGAVGSYSIVFGSLGTGVTTDFIKETQVKTAGFEAEFGQSTGGVINVVTQSGTNEIHGSVFGYLRPEALEGDYEQLQTENGTVNTVGSQNADFGLSLGGPVLKDKLFFFGAFNPQFQRLTRVAPDGFPLCCEEFDRERKIYSYAGKLTWQAGMNHRFDVSAFGDPAKGDMGPQRVASLIRETTSGFSELTKYGGHNQVVKYDGIISRSWLIEASVARAYNIIEETPSVDTWSVSDRTVTPFVTTGGIGFYEQGNEGTNLQFQLKSTNLFEGAGSHQIRYGVAYEDIAYNNTNQRTGPTFTMHNGVQTTTGAAVQVLSAPEVPGGRIWRVIRANYNPARETDQTYINFFLQDTWQVNDRLTIRPGVRYEQQKLIGGDNPALCHANDSRPGAGDGTGELIPCEITWDNNWSPRVGATYDVRGDGKSKIFASFGRFYAKIPNDLAVRALSADAGLSRGDYYDANLTRPIPDGVLAAGVTSHFLLAGTHASVIDPESKSTYQDEILAGAEVEVRDNLSLGVRWVHRTLPRILEDYQPAPLVAFEVGCPGADSVEYLLGNISPDIQRFECAGLPTASFEDPEHTYDSVEVTANKIFSENWSLMASYRWSKLEGNFEGFFRNDNGQSDPAITSLFDFPTNDPSYAQIGVPQFGYRGDIRYQGCTLGCGLLPNDRPHQIKLYGTYSWSSLNFGVAYNGGSGKPLTALAANPNYGNSGEIPEGLRGSGSDTVDGFLERTDFSHVFDLHADYTIKFGDSQRVMLIADVFNVLDNQDPTDFDTYTESSFTALNPNYGEPMISGGLTPSFRIPRQIRFGARFEW